MLEGVISSDIARTDTAQIGVDRDQEGVIIVSLGVSRG